MQTPDPNSIREWLVPVSTAVTLLSTAIAAWVAVLNYRLKVKAEHRLRESTQAEVDTKLSKAFSDLMWIAHARSGSHASEKLIEGALNAHFVNADYFRNPRADQKKQLLEEACILNLPVGVASQNAAIMSIAVLGRRYEILREPAQAALKSISEFKPNEARAAIDLLEKS